MKYDKAGKHTYALREVNGGTISKGITYDGTTHTIVTTITDKGDGTLEAKHELRGAEDAKNIKFENTYSVAPLEAEVDFG